MAEGVPKQEGKEAVDFNIRDIAMGDCDDMVALWNSLVAEKAPIARQTPKTREQQKDEIEFIMDGIRKREVVYNVVEKDGHVVGTAVISKGKGEENGNVGTLGLLALKKESRGRGIAGDLLDRTIADAQRVLDINEVELVVFAFNESAIKLYRNHGFVETGKSAPPKDYYGELHERLEMHKVL